MLDEGVEAPPFNLSDQTGANVSLDEFSGKWVAMWWYPKASTPG